MAMDAATIERLIREALPDAQVTIEDLRGDGDHYAAHVVSPAFKGKSRVQQHQMVYQVADQRARALSEFAKGSEMTTNNTVLERIKQDISDNPVLLYMKGTPVFPQCGFSAAVVQILTHIGVKFKGVDVLSDPEIRQGIKEFSSWPTIPQLYVKGEFVGGSDIVREMFESGELTQLLQSKGLQTRA
jgi:monothiol glutaredoxin